MQAEIAADAQQWDVSDELYKKAIALLSKLGHKARLADTALRYSHVLRERGDLEGALEMALQAAGAGARESHGKRERVAS